MQPDVSSAQIQLSIKKILAVPMVLDSIIKGRGEGQRTARLGAVGQFGHPEGEGGGYGRRGDGKGVELTLELRPKPLA